MPASRVAINRRYNCSPKGKNRHRRYEHSAKGLLRRMLFEMLHPGRSAQRQEAGYWRTRYHMLQDVAGCHRSPDSFLPAYRLLEALKTAEVVEI